MAKITLQGMSTYASINGGSLWDEIILPNQIDKEVLVDTIILRCGEFEVLYADVDFFKSAINAFFNKYNRTFKKWAEALEIEYNPLENYDRNEEWTDISKGSSNDSASGSTVDYKTAYDSDTIRRNAQDNTSSKSETNMTNDATHKGRTHGNIGVTTSQQMLQSELDIAQWTIYNHIADLFVEELMVAVYY